MVHKVTIQRLQFLFGTGTIVRHPPKENRNETWRWCVVSREAEKILYLVKPFLITKLDEAKLALEFMQIPREHYGCPNEKDGRSKRKCSPKIIQLKDSIYWKMRQLKPSWKTRPEEIKAL
jgi:hypothetical protein